MVNGLPRAVQPSPLLGALSPLAGWKAACYPHCQIEELSLADKDGPGAYLTTG